MASTKMASLVMVVLLGLILLGSQSEAHLRYGKEISTRDILDKLTSDELDALIARLQEVKRKREMTRKREMEMSEVELLTQLLQKARKQK